MTTTTIIIWILVAIAAALAIAASVLAAYIIGTLVNEASERAATRRKLDAMREIERRNAQRIREWEDRHDDGI